MTRTADALSPKAALEQTILQSYLKQLRLPAMARECVALAREAEQRQVGYLGYLQALLEREVTPRAEHQLSVFMVICQIGVHKNLPVASSQ